MVGQAAGDERAREVTDHYMNSLLDCWIIGGKKQSRNKEMLRGFIRVLIL